MLPFVLAVAIWVTVVAAVVFYKLFGRLLARRRNRVERQLAAVFHLDTADFAGVAAPGIEWMATRLACLRNMYKVKTYCSRTIVQDLANSKLADRHFMQFAWRLDFAEPDGWHITQQSIAVDGPDLWDEWISVRGDNFQNMGLWVQTGL